MNTRLIGAVVLLSAGSLALRFAGRSARRGVVPVLGTSRDHEPERFRDLVTRLVLFGAGAVGLGLLLAFQDSPPPDVTDVESDDLDGYGSRFDWFVGEHLANVFAILGVVVSGGGAAYWAWLQRRTMEQITAAADAAEDEDRDG